MDGTKKKFLILILIVAVGCSGGKNRGKFLFDNNMEGSCWAPSGSVMKSADAHSGNYMCIINRSNAFTTVFELKVKDISEKPLKAAKISAWFMMTGENSEQNLVLEVRDSTNQKTLEWINTNAQDYIDDLNKWYKVDLIVDLKVNNRNNPENIFKVYASNGKDDMVYVDDINVEFE